MEVRRYRVSDSFEHIQVDGRTYLRKQWFAKESPTLRSADDAIARIMSGDLVSEGELQAALRAYDHAAPVEATLIRGRARRLGHIEDGGDEGDSGTLPVEETQLVADAAANTINHTLARLFLRLGPPPESANGEYMPVSSGGGGAQQ
ncbi:hypothetical protein CLM62_40850 [Streptomyces sp. SA15]|nr:hypothetical protein CLM62_40850 [Streptomyces sp. SA15]